MEVTVMQLLGNHAAGPRVRDDQPLAAVDAALEMVSRSGLVTVEEALRLLRGVEAAAGDGAGYARICGIVADASTSYAGQMLLDRDRVVDPLLDIRLAISH
jgi:hypothetical protein